MQTYNWFKRPQCARSGLQGTVYTLLREFNTGANIKANHYLSILEILHIKPQMPVFWVATDDVSYVYYRNGWTDDNRWCQSLQDSFSVSYNFWYKSQRQCIQKLRYFKLKQNGCPTNRKTMMKNIVYRKSNKWKKANKVHCNEAAQKFRGKKVRKIQKVESLFWLLFQYKLYELKVFNGLFVFVLHQFNIERSKLRGFGQVVRMPLGCLPAEVFGTCPTGRRPRICSRVYTSQLGKHSLCPRGDGGGGCLCSCPILLASTSWGVQQYVAVTVSTCPQ